MKKCHAQRITGNDDIHPRQNGLILEDTIFIFIRWRGMGAVYFFTTFSGSIRCPWALVKQYTGGAHCNEIKRFEPIIPVCAHDGRDEDGQTCEHLATNILRYENTSNQVSNFDPIQGCRHDCESFLIVFNQKWVLPAVECCWNILQKSYDCTHGVIKLEEALNESSTKIETI